MITSNTSDVNNNNPIESQIKIFNSFLNDKNIERVEVIDPVSGFGIILERYQIQSTIEYWKSLA